MPDTLEQTNLAEQVRQQLSMVIDPEMGRSVVEMGLIYLIEVTAGGDAHILMTTTTKGCPASAFLREAIQACAASVHGVKEVDVELTYNPPWNPSMMMTP
ncbi:metal-sulfur cluster assembly factor [Rhizobium terrae]|uniref:metal-sulfur cluster assembly factor n=1 Tax=Rhizobium terrae TaxID=2171756 RepID=UPI000E3B87C8|nr:metal-sulfur cluster assembly factor [Rhizobium terrae]